MSDRESSVDVRPIASADAGEVLTLQRAAFVQEAHVYGDPNMPPLTQTLEQLEAELEDNVGCVAVSGSRIVGAARAVVDDRRLLIGRIAVAPDQQGEGIGSLLLETLEDTARQHGCREAELFTGSLSAANITLYERVGYVRSDRIAQGDGTAQIFLRKRIEGPPDRT